MKTPVPTLQVQAAGPGQYTWRVYDAAASFATRTHTAYAAGRVSFPADGSQDEMNRAYGTARGEAAAALGQVRSILRRH